MFRPLTFWLVRALNLLVSIRTNCKHSMFTVSQLSFHHPHNYKELTDARFKVCL